jgi:hypothetical protein
MDNLTKSRLLSAYIQLLLLEIQNLVDILISFQLEWIACIYGAPELWYTDLKKIFSIFGRHSNGYILLSLYVNPALHETYHSLDLTFACFDGSKDFG